MIKYIIEDIKNVFKKDSVTISYLKIFFCYPVLHAIWMYRINHFFMAKAFLFFGDTFILYNKTFYRNIKSILELK